ncbi:MAG: rod shape-determining protein MreC [Streptosporangiales bacterium]|nr:rod shape-determining protein MreC [Streptosporangiales bacterium]
MRDTRRTRLTLGLLLVVAFTLITVDFRGGDASPLETLRGLGSAVFGPVERVAAAIVRPVRHTIDAVGGLGESQRRISDLERQNRELRERLRASELSRSQSEQLEELLHLAGLGRYRVVGARVVALRGTQGFENTGTIDAGSRDGIERNMTVVNGDGLVGRVTSVGPTTSTVLLASDAASAVGGRLEGTGEIGVVTGRGEGTSGGRVLRFELLDPTAPIEPGQRIVTFGSQGGAPYVPGVPVGTVRSVSSTPGALTRVALVEPFANFTALDVVGVVVKPPRTDPRDSVLPPKPTPSPTPTSVSASPSRSPNEDDSAADRGR